MRADWFFAFLMAALALALFIAVMEACSDVDRKERLMRQCREDGRKEYECYSLIEKRGNAAPVVVPMPMPR